MWSGGRTRTSVAAALVAGLALVGAPAHAADAADDRHVGAATTPVVGVTRTTVTVGGVVGGEATAVGADLGAQARFARANRRGGVGGRTIEYAGAQPVTDTAAAARRRRCSRWCPR